MINCISCGKPPTLVSHPGHAELPWAGPEDVLAELQRREGISGIDEKAPGSSCRGRSIVRLMPNWMPNCIFCRIVRGEIPSRKLYEDDECSRFTTSIRSRPVHFLMIPKEHVGVDDGLEDAHRDVLGKMMVLAPQLAREQGSRTAFVDRQHRAGGHGRK